MTAAAWGVVRPRGATDDGAVTVATAAPAAGTLVEAAATTADGDPAPAAVPAEEPDDHSDAPLEEPTPVNEAEAIDAPTVAAGALTTAVDAADRSAGLRSVTVPQRGSGRLGVVPGGAAAPGKGRVYRVRVEVESTLDVDGRAFADFVLATLNDPRSWGRGGRMTFARSAGAADLRVILATPQTSARMCRPLVTQGTVSCARGNAAILTYYRWVQGTTDYGADRTGYRRYLVNHEVGHTLGHHHEFCPGKGKRAPVMMQQTKGLKGCVKNSWPYPGS